MNKCTALGRLGKDIELTYSKDGKAIGKFSLGVTRKFNKDITDWFNCVSFGKQAETLARYVKKGQQLLVSGEIHFGSYDAQDGTKRYTTTLVINEFDFIAAGQNNSNNEAVYENTFAEPIDDGDMPF
jgi:single-strand DNA-binding protein